MTEIEKLTTQIQGLIVVIGDLIADTKKNKTDKLKLDEVSQIVLKLCEWRDNHDKGLVERNKGLVAEMKVIIRETLENYKPPERHYDCDLHKEQMNTLRENMKRNAQTAERAHERVDKLKDDVTFRVYLGVVLSAVIGGLVGFFSKNF